MSTTPSLQSRLRQPYQRGEWQSLLHSLFPDGTLKLFSTPQPLTASQEKVKSTLQLGTIELEDGNTIALLEVETTDQLKLARNRVGLRNFVSTYIDEAGASAVLAVFHQENASDWRLTYAARQTTLDEETSQIVTLETAPRRFTFLLGKNEPCRTAAGRLYSLLEKGAALTLADVEKAFSVEKLSKEFFEKYREHYQTFVDELLSPQKQQATRKRFGVPSLADGDQQDRADKPIRDFVKTLLGRFVFLHFLQKKGWLGCPKGGTAWTGGDPDFLNSLFQQALSKKEAASFHSKYLAPLFFEALNLPDRPGDLFPLTNTRLPYLSGGLFEEKNPAQRAIDFPADVFERLLAFFAEYNFTIDENDPEDHEVGIDPEMLGHIFENQLEDNKEKGAYYTPKVVVSYMARESLLHYLQTHLGKHKELSVLLNEKDSSKHEGKNSFVAQNRDRVAELLDRVKICDPAIGSGAFPIGVLQEILWTRLALQPERNTPHERAILKRQIIQNSIHGVDLDPGAVEIARLRFWLSLVVDEDEPRPLPNLDYKIMQGNSLLESFEGIDLSRLHSRQDAPGYRLTSLVTKQAELDLLDSDQEEFRISSGQTRSVLDEARKDYFDERLPERKLQLRQQIDSEVLRHIGTCLEFELGQVNGLIDQQQKISKGLLPRPRGWTPVNGSKKLKALHDKLHAQEASHQKLKALAHASGRPFFLWHLFFQDVFEQGGFDIVIANPPYVRHELIRDQKPLLEKEGYRCYTGTADLFVYFYEQAVNLLKPQGALTFITSNKYYRAGYGEKLRGHLAKELSLQTLIDFRDAPVFNEVIAYASILIGLKQEAPAGHEVATLVWDPTKKAAALPREIHKAFPVRQDTLTPDGWRLVDPTVNALLQKLRANGTPLGEYVNGQFYRGILTGFNEAFVIDGRKRAELIAADPKSEAIIKPFLRGRDVKRWQAIQQDLWLIFTRRGIDIALYPAIKKHLEQFREALEPKPSGWPSNKEWPGRKAGSYRWFEIQDNIAYYEEFEGPKVIYPNQCSRAEFHYEKLPIFTNQKTFILTGCDASLASILNSSVTGFIFPYYLSPLQNGFWEPSKLYLELFPIPTASPTEKTRLTALAESCAKAAAKNDSASIVAHESEINQIVYRLFDLNAEEIALIESSLPS
jgi:hypothetical protein